MIGSEEFLALLDTGATHNFLKEDLVQKLNLSYQRGPFTPIQLATQQAITRPIGTTPLTMTILGTAFPTDALICKDLREDLILGHQWLKNVRAVYDISNDRVYLGNVPRISLPTVFQPKHPGQPVDFSEIHEEFPETKKSEFRKLLSEFSMVFQPLGSSFTTAATHELRLTTDRPVRIRPRHCNLHKRRIIEQEVTEMLRDGIIEPSTSPYNAPIVIAPKRDGGHRFCIDYKNLNDVTVDTTPQIPVIHHILKSIGKAGIFSTLDLKSGYWQIPLTPESKEYTAFTTPDGCTYQFRVMPFGLKTAPASFQRMMNGVLQGYVGDFCAVYLDDIIVYSETWETHLEHLQLVFERLAVHGLIVSLKKCRFGAGKLPFLGHNVTSAGNEAQDRHVEAILKIEIPRTKKQVQELLGKIGWLREYIPRYAILTAPITDTLRGREAWKWTPPADDALRTLKQRVTKPLTLGRPMEGATYVVDTFAEELGACALLSQHLADGTRPILSHASCKFSPTEMRYNSSERDCLAVIWALRNYRPYLEDHPFVLRTDPKALKWLEESFTKKAKLSRWREFLEEFKFVVEDLEPVPGKPLNDLLRNTEVCTSPAGDMALQQLEAPTLLEEVLEAQQHDSHVQEQVAKLRKMQRQPNDPGVQNDWLNTHQANDLGFQTRQNSQAYWRILVPASLRLRVIQAYHEDRLAGHPGMDETIRAILQYYTWPGLTRDVRTFVSACRLCCCVKPHRIPGRDCQRPRQPTTPFQTIALDLMGPYPRTRRGKRHLLVVTDLFTRWVEAYPLGEANSSQIVNILEKDFFPRWGYPQHLLSDNGPQFTSRQWIQACRRNHIKPWTTPPYLPRANPTERRNQEIKKGLRLRLEDEPHNRWDEKLSDVLFNVRNRRNAATGVSPCEALFGRNALRPGEWQHEEGQWSSNLRDRVDAIRDHQQHYTSRPQPEKKLPTYRPGDAVYLRRHQLSKAADNYCAGLATPWEGPFLIHEHVHGDVYRVRRGDALIKVHSSQVWSPSTATSYEGQSLLPRNETKVSSEEDMPALLPEAEIGGFPSVSDETRIAPAPRRRGRPRKEVKILEQEPEAILLSEGNATRRYNLRKR